MVPFASAHSLIVDTDFVLGMHSPLGPEVIPDGDLVRETLIANTWDFGRLGVANAHTALSGFSIWLGVSAFFFGLIDANGLSRKLPRELFYRLSVINAVAYAVLTVFAFVFWIAAFFGNRKKARPGLVILAAVMTLVIFSIPHSLFGSELSVQELFQNPGDHLCPIYLGHEQSFAPGESPTVKGVQAIHEGFCYIRSIIL